MHTHENICNSIDVACGDRESSETGFSLKPITLHTYNLFLFIHIRDVCLYLVMSISSVPFVWGFLAFSFQGWDNYDAHNVLLLTFI